MSADIPVQPELTPELAYNRLQLWYQQREQLKTLRNAESAERRTLAFYYIPVPREGTNRLALGGGFDLKVVHKLNRNVDEAALDNVTKAQIKELKLPWDELFKYEPTLVKKVYDELSTEQRAFVDTLLDIKEGLPDMEIVPSVGVAQEQTAYVDDALNPAAAAAEAMMVVSIEDPDLAKLGDYYEDGDKQWWHCTGITDNEPDWEQCANPNGEQPEEKPRRGRRKKA